MATSLGTLVTPARRHPRVLYHIDFGALIENALTLPEFFSEVVPT